MKEKREFKYRVLHNLDNPLFYFFEWWDNPFLIIMYKYIFNENLKNTHINIKVKYVFGPYKYINFSF